MDPFFALAEPVLHFNDLLPGLFQQYGIWIYFILFLVIFCETGLVIAPYLPGDSLLFLAGSLAGMTDLNPWILVCVFTIGAVLGDSVNYWIGHKVGRRWTKRENSFIRPEHIRKTEEFFQKYGGKTIVIARFVPVVRTFAPFLAGIGVMEYRHFLTYNVLGGTLWVLLLVSVGYFFGNIPVVQDNFEIFILAVIGLVIVTVAIVLREVYRTARASSVTSEQ